MRMMKLRHVATVSNSNVDKVIDPTETPVRLCNYVHVYKNDVIEEKMQFDKGSATRKEIEAFGIKVGDVIITKDSEDRFDIGVPALIRSTAEDIVCGYHLTILRPLPQVTLGPFLFYALLAHPVRDAFSLAANGVTRYGLTQNGMKEIVIGVPDISTQEVIVRFLDQWTTRVDRMLHLMGATNGTDGSLASLLLEKRKAVITAAVTGQLDVTAHAGAGATDRALDEIEAKVIA